MSNAVPSLLRPPLMPPRPGPRVITRSSDPGSESIGLGAPAASSAVATPMPGTMRGEQLLEAGYVAPMLELQSADPVHVEVDIQADRALFGANETVQPHLDPSLMARNEELPHPSLEPSSSMPEPSPKRRWPLVLAILGVLAAVTVVTTTVFVRDAGQTPGVEGPTGRVDSGRQRSDR